MLLDAGADGRIHPVTKYSPLYISCYHGHKEMVSMLLKVYIAEFIIYQNLIIQIIINWFNSYRSFPILSKSLPSKNGFLFMHAA